MKITICRRSAKIKKETSFHSENTSFQSNFVKEIEKNVLADIEYIKNFVSSAPNAKIASNYEDARIVKAVTGSVYPQVFAYIVKNLNREEAIQKLREMGRRSVAVFFSTSTKNLPKKVKFKNLFREIGRHSGELYRITDITKKKGVIESCTIKKRRCVFCYESIKMEDVDVPYCYPSVSFHQHYYNIRSLYRGNVKPRLIYIDIVKTAEHDKDYCEYHMTAID